MSNFSFLYLVHCNSSLFISFIGWIDVGVSGGQFLSGFLDGELPVYFDLLVASFFYNGQYFFA